MTILNLPSSTEAHYDSIGQAYEVAFAGNTKQKESVQWLLQALRGVNGKSFHPSRIVDIGCGTGRPVVEMLANAGHDVVGIDISQAMVNAGRSNVPNAAFEKIDMREFFRREAPASFDAATTYFAGLAGLKQDEYRATVRAIAELIKPGGFFVFATVPKDGDCLPMKWMGRDWIVSSLSADDALTTVKKAGFEVLEHHVSQFLPKGSLAGLCKQGEDMEETHFYVYARKSFTHADGTGTVKEFANGAVSGLVNGTVNGNGNVNGAAFH